MARQLGEMIIPYEIEKIQRDCKWFSIDTVRIALELYKKLGLIFENNDGILAISDFDRLIGSQTYGAEKKQLQRVEDKCPPICPPEKDIKRLRDKENREEDIDKKKKRDNKIQEFPEVVLRIFNHWKSKGIYPREDLTEKKAKAIQKALKSYSEEEITFSIDRYSSVIFDKSFYFNTKWYIDTFMTQGNCLPNFTENGERWLQYCAYLNEPKKTNNTKTEKERYGNFDPEEAFQKALERSYGKL